MKKITYLLPAIITSVLFTIWTILVKVVDVQFISGIGFLGFYDLNTSVNDFVKTLNSGLFDKVTDIMFYLSFATVIPFAVIGVVQLIKTKSLKKVDAVIYYMLGAYVLIAVGYAIFEVFKVNYSPLSTTDNIKASYPSSHVFIFVTLLFVGLTGLLHFVKMNKVLKFVYLGAVSALSIAMALTRLFSGNHYLTDVIGAVLLASAIITIPYSIYKFTLVKEETKEEEN